MPKKNEGKKMNPYLKDAELKPCEWCKMKKPSHNNITTMIEENNRRKEQNKNNISQKKIFGNEANKKK